MSKLTVREDETGIYVQQGSEKYRPGDIIGYSHALDMDDAGLKVGDKVNISRSPGGPIRLLTEAGRVVHWASQFEHDQEARWRSVSPEERAATERTLADIFQPTRVIHVAPTTGRKF